MSREKSFMQKGHKHISKGLEMIEQRMNLYANLPDRSTFFIASLIKPIFAEMLPV